MLNLKKKPTALDSEIDRMLDLLKDLDVTNAKFEPTLKSLERLYELKEKNSPKPISRDAILTVGANLTGIAMIIGYEHAHVITSKAFSTLLKKSL